MGTARRQYTDEFKREVVGLLASSSRPLSQIAQELGIPAARLRAWRNRSGGGRAESPQRLNTQAAISHASADLAADNARLRRENGRPRMEREILKKTLRIFSEPSKMKFRIIEAQCETFPVRVLCDVMSVSPSGYHACVNGGG
jgi:transposase